ncbi:MAG: glycosyltransferase [Candidatus Aminicenantes bacterium]|nr:glycosyltransferase [Candidatus Aminicenantes bacterium]NIQ65460.1 glycosyltransferase [Candidatus Aminicenantes bacterium]
MDNIINNPVVFSMKHLGKKPIKKIIKKKYLNSFSVINRRGMKKIVVSTSDSMLTHIKYGDNYRLLSLFFLVDELNKNFLYVGIVWESLKSQEILHHATATLIDAENQNKFWIRLPLGKLKTKIKKGDLVFGMIEVSVWDVRKSQNLGLRLVIPGEAALTVEGGEADKKKTRLLTPLSQVRSKKIGISKGEKKDNFDDLVFLGKPSPHKNKYKLITTLYNEKKRKRIKEYSKCLKINYNHALIDEIHVLYDTNKDDAGRKSRLLKFLEKNPGIEKVYIKGRPTYEEMFNYANSKFPESRIIICNADIYFNETLVLLNDVDLVNTFLVLSRWDVVSGEKARLIHDRFNDFNYMSADAWIFKTPLNINFTCDYRLGTMFCDSFLNSQLFKSGLNVYNPCFDVQACHLHKDWEEVKLRKSKDYSIEQKLKIWRVERLRTGPKPGVGVYWCKVADLKKEPREPYIWGLDKKKMVKTKRENPQDHEIKTKGEKMSLNKNNPKISVVMIDGSFRESFHAVDFFCQQTLAIEGYELIWVEFYDRVNPELEKKISQYPNARVVTLDHKDEIYHSSLCFNAGIKESSGDIIFIPDADIAVEPYFLEEALKEHEKNHKLVMYFYRKEEEKKDHRDHFTLEYLKKVCKFKNPSNYGGCLSVRKKWLEEINGYEQHPVFGSGFHANGIDVFTRFKNLGLQVMWHPELLLYHPWHPLNAAGFPVWETQKTITNYRAKYLLTRAYQGHDPAKNQELPADLEKQLENAIKKYKLDKVFDNWYNLKVDPGDVREELFTREYMIEKDRESRNKTASQNNTGQKNTVFTKLMKKFRK